MTEYVHLVGGGPYDGRTIAPLYVPEVSVAMRDYVVVCQKRRFRYSYWRTNVLGTREFSLKGQE